MRFQIEKAVFRFLRRNLDEALISKAGQRSQRESHKTKGFIKVARNSFQYLPRLNQVKTCLMNEYMVARWFEILLFLILLQSVIDKLEKLKPDLVKLV